MKKGRILVVDDQEEILESLGAILTDEGHSLIKARDGQEALHIVQSDSPDIVFLDIWIPGIDGMQTLKAIKKIDPQCSVIMMSGHGTIETAVKAIKLGATDYLEKPLNLEDVLHLVDKAILVKESEKTNSGNGTAQAHLIGTSSKVAGLKKTLEKTIAQKGAVWLAGEKGTGKEFLARVIHQMEGKDRDNLIKIRCTELTTENVRESLLGKKSGSGSVLSSFDRRRNEKTLLLVRVDRLARDVRDPLAAILRELMISDGKNPRSDSSEFRILSTSLTDADDLVRTDGFPQELADLLAQRVVRVPSLRERPDDIPLYIDHFLREAGEEFDRNTVEMDNEAMDRLLAYPWPGNVKELKVLIEHVVMTAPGSQITANDLLIPMTGVLGNSGVDTIIEATPEPVTSESTPNVTIIPGPADREVMSESSNSRQKTLRGRVVMYGQGLHSGVKTGLTLSPLPPSSGILFGHITSAGTVPAVISNVESTELSTCLKRNGLLAKTIEHLMAVFHVYGLTNVLVKISGEVPIMDGSALQFCNLVENAEIIVQEDPIEEVRITEPIELPVPSGSPKFMRVEPSDCLEVDYFLDYPPPIGTMQMCYRCDGPESFKQEIAPARTFGFVKHMRMMDEMGLAGGGRLSNVILLDDEKVVNPPLRYENEFVRHKILDIIGDFYLFGRPFKGKIIARRTGHTENIAMLKLIGEKMGIL
ncbi:UDP-3-O-acyl-N-acetylglucosamine deacetylase [Desulfomonile tiedjei]|uniref:UDP-3-O-acyl-N-acetylglucosamine deacetylase n=1 Tax=Desulfomonile tiedjei (strain ATCC 49306 / DSM 6799 / DCB-1) TaxID=706587 RepID=I4CAU3_DESTA|nr:UDP-3-O-acyl-N-acetylglucosamine deacetylase [Desulfomonile tiedjei]AFM26684.1 UDP-3-O-(3-hydroxymyristoyl) N-acetylglucosamine deacetylase [Desulfomonile tiedjei DSM 6799]